jgi:hypothetical protein
MIPFASTNDEKIGADGDSQTRLSKFERLYIF